MCNNITAAVERLVVVARGLGPQQLPGLLAQPQSSFLRLLLQIKPGDDRASFQNVHDLVQLRDEHVGRQCTTGHVSRSPFTLSGPILLCADQFKYPLKPSFVRPVSTPKDVIYFASKYYFQQYHK